MEEVVGRATSVLDRMAAALGREAIGRPGFGKWRALAADFRKSRRRATRGTSYTSARIYDALARSTPGVARYLPPSPCSRAARDVL